MNLIKHISISVQLFIPSVWREKVYASTARPPWPAKGDAPDTHVQRLNGLIVSTVIIIMGMQREGK